MKVTASTESAASLDSFPGCDGAFPMTVMGGGSASGKGLGKAMLLQQLCFSCCCCWLLGSLVSFWWTCLVAVDDGCD